MKRLLLTAALITCAASPAIAQIHGALSEARVVPVNSRLGGAYLQFDKNSASLMGQLRLSFYPNIDFGFLGGLSRIDVDNNTRTSVRLGGDFRGQVATQGTAFPLNVSLGGAIGVESADNFTILAVGPQVVFSRAFDGAGKWLGYGGASLLMSRFDVGAKSDTDTSFPIRAGFEFRPNADLRILTEAQLAVSDEIRDDFSLTLGVLFPF
jgi:opacity protein-like surface antigen